MLEEIYKDHLHMAQDVEGDDMLVEYHIQYALMCYLLFLVGMSMFVDKSATCIDVVYLKYFTDLIVIHEYNWGCLFGLPVKLGEGYLWKKKQMT